MPKPVYTARTISRGITSRADIRFIAVLVNQTENIEKTLSLAFFGWGVGEAMLTNIDLARSINAIGLQLFTPVG